MTNTLLITEKTIKNLTNLSDNMNGKLLLPAIREAQDINLREILGDDLLNSLVYYASQSQDEIPDAYYSLLVKCQYYLAYQAISNICMITSVKIDNAGLQRISDEHMEPLSVGDVNQITSYYQKKADYYCLLLQNFLIDNRTDYPELDECQCNKIQSHLYSSASCGIVLGGPRSKYPVYPKLNPNYI